MVCVMGENGAYCIVRDVSGRTERTPSSQFTATLPCTTSARELVRQAASFYGYQPQAIELSLTLSTGETMVLKDSSEETLQSVGLKVESRYSFNLDVVNSRLPPKIRENNVPEEELNLGASASPTTAGDYPSYQVPPPPASQSIMEYPYTAGLIKQDTGYVGLVNQAMTCYLNSLLQALYMTPEFRNALYKWQYDGHTNGHPTKCIPYQLQRLFLNLQTSHKTAVETTELTRSFGWDSSEAWQQHDIQELCRVMFDALEQVFKGTKQADLIDRLYQGKMIDYVKCLECSKEKSREDTFLDIPLPVRPFGSTVAYGSVVEALRAFVQPETLEGANQYFCESCAKKCDAHKGLKFTKFPYLLTLHLKRFDFDYSTMHRIKLNDKVVFPEKLDLNSFVDQTQAGSVVDKEEGSEGIPDELTVSKCDDSSTTDSGSALDDEGCQTTTDLPVSHDMNQDDDEGIDVSGGNGSSHHENEKNRRHNLNKAPYQYELFSIMIHSGSASGGHYYAYIKDFSTEEWYCFNDTSVTPITTDDITKTFGGGAMRGYYSGAYSSSTNAYMLMYRQISEENCEAMKIEDLPDHIKELYKEIQEKQETDRRIKERHSEMSKIKVYCHHPKKGLMDVKVYTHNDTNLYDVTNTAFDTLQLGGVVARADCRLVTYNPEQESIELSFEGRDNELLTDIMIDTRLDNLLLEIKSPDDEFEAYQPGGMTVKIYIVDVDREEVQVPPIVIRTSLSDSVAEMKQTISTKCPTITPDNMGIVVDRCVGRLHVIDDDTITVQEAGVYTSSKTYVCKGPIEKPFINSKLNTLIDRFEHVITLHLTLPDTDPDTLARMSIPSLSSVQAAAAAKQAGDSINNPQEKAVVEPAVTTKSCGSRGLMLPLILTGAGDEEGGGVGSSGTGGGHSDQSTSEDSSLTDSDRTLIGDVQDECMSEGDNPLGSPPEEEPAPLPPPEEENWEEPTPPRQYTYFKADPYNSDSKKMLKVLVDKRMTVDAMKLCLEPYLGVPASCFKLFRCTGQTDYETPRARACDTLSSLKSDDVLSVRLGRQLTSDEQKIKVHQLVINSTQPIKYLCEWIVAKGGTVGQTKKEIIDDVNKRCSLNLQFERCRLRKKNWKNVGRVYLDSQKWGTDVQLYTNGDIFLQELYEEEPVTSDSQLNMFVRHWHPSTLTLDPFEEIVLDTSNIDELKQKLSQKSGIPLENVEIAKPSGFFPCDMSVLSIHSELDWNTKATVLDGWPMQFTEDGGTLFYKDSREEVKTLSLEERNELAAKESARLQGVTGSMNSYSPRKERPLKIYLDRRPCATAEVDID